MLLRVLLIYCILKVTYGVSREIQQRIIGGTTTTITKIPYQIAVYKNNYFTCGGSLITKDCVLTAAHCVAGHKPNALNVRAGLTLLSSIGGETRSVVQIHIPFQFNLKTLNMDAAVLKLNSPLGGTNIATVELSDKQVNAGDQLQVSGWGLTLENSSKVSNQLRVVTVPVVPTVICKQQYPMELTDSMFCAGSLGKDSCAGDSGGPTIKDGKQVGIISWGNGCGRVDFSGVYTSIRHILPWIKGLKLKYCRL